MISAEPNPVSDRIFSLCMSILCYTGSYAVASRLYSVCTKRSSEHTPETSGWRHMWMQLLIFDLFLQCTSLPSFLYHSVSDTIHPTLCLVQGICSMFGVSGSVMTVSVIALERLSVVKAAQEMKRYSLGNSYWYRQKFYHCLSIGWSCVIGIWSASSNSIQLRPAGAFCAPQWHDSSNMALGITSFLTLCYVAISVSIPGLIILTTLPRKYIKPVASKIIGVILFVIAHWIGYVYMQITEITTQRPVPVYVDRVATLLGYTGSFLNLLLYHTGDTEKQNTFRKALDDLSHSDVAKPKPTSRSSKPQPKPLSQLSNLHTIDIVQLPPPPPNDPGHHKQNSADSNMGGPQVFSRNVPDIKHGKYIQGPIHVTTTIYSPYFVPG